MNKDFHHTLRVELIPKIIALIARVDGLDELTAIDEFYRSDVYFLLSREQTRLWQCSPAAIYKLYKHKKTTEEIIFPEKYAISKKLPFIILCIEEYKSKEYMNGEEVMNLFNKYSVLEYIQTFYDVLHTTGSKYIVDDIKLYIQSCMEEQN